MHESRGRYAQALDEAEAQIRGNRLETAYVLDGEGNVLFRRQGGASRVDLSDVPPERLRGNVVTHNHPWQSSFSEQDVRFAIQFGPAEMRVVTTRYRHALRLPPHVEWDDVQPLIDMVGQGVYERLRSMLLYDEITAEEYAERLWHEIWSEVADIKGWDYRREEWTP